MGDDLWLLSEFMKWYWDIIALIFRCDKEREALSHYNNLLNRRNVTLAFWYMWVLCANDFFSAAPPYECAADKLIKNWLRNQWQLQNNAQNDKSSGFYSLQRIRFSLFLPSWNKIVLTQRLHILRGESHVSLIRKVVMQWCTFHITHRFCFAWCLLPTKNEKPPSVFSEPWSRGDW